MPESRERCLSSGGLYETSQYSADQTRYAPRGLRKPAQEPTVKRTTRLAN